MQKMPLTILLQPYIKEALRRLAHANRRTLTGEIEHMIVERARSQGLLPERDEKIPLTPS